MAARQCKRMCAQAGQAPGEGGGGAGSGQSVLFYLWTPFFFGRHEATMEPRDLPRFMEKSIALHFVKCGYPPVHSRYNPQNFLHRLYVPLTFPLERPYPSVPPSVLLHDAPLCYLNDSQLLMVRPLVTWNLWDNKESWHGNGPWNRNDSWRSDRRQRKRYQSTPGRSRI